MHSLSQHCPREAADRQSRERGAAAVIFAFLLPVLFGSIALALDVGKLVYERQHLSNASTLPHSLGQLHFPATRLPHGMPRPLRLPRQTTRQPTLPSAFGAWSPPPGAAKTVKLARSPASVTRERLPVRSATRRSAPSPVRRKRPHLQHHHSD